MEVISGMRGGGFVGERLSSPAPSEGGWEAMEHRLVSLIDCGHARESSWTAARQVFEELPEWGSAADVAVSGPAAGVIQAGRSASGPVVGLFFADEVKGVAVGRAPCPLSVEHKCLGDRNLVGVVPLPYSFSDQLRMSEGVGRSSWKDGCPAIILSEVELQELAKPLQMTLIGKFPAGRPKWIALEKFFDDLKLRGGFKIANLDARHFYIHLQHWDDYTRLFSKRVMFINSFLMKMMKWTMDFNVNSEPSVCPVWISLPFVGLHLYSSAMLFSIASVFGRPLTLDYATRHWSRPCSARILVEMDVMIQHPNAVWIGIESTGYFQKVIFENLPSFCLHCRKIGHNKETYFVRFPELRKEYVLVNGLDVGQQESVDQPVGIEVNTEVDAGGCVPVGDDIIGLGPEIHGLSHGDGVVEIAGGVEQSQLVDGVDVVCENRECSVAEACPRGVGLIQHGDFSTGRSNSLDMASTSKRFTRSSLKKINGQQVVLQWQGTESNMEKVMSIIDRVLDDNVRLEELRRQREIAGILKDEERKKREEKKVAAVTCLQAKFDSKKCQGKGKGKKK